MSNVLARIIFRVDIPEEKAVVLVGRADDDSTEWFNEACQAVHLALEGDPLHYMEQFSLSPPDVEVD